MSASELQWCRARLPEVSRSFALGIQALPHPIESWVTVAYLLCRVVDTVEDRPDLEEHTRRALFRTFQQALDGGDPAAFVEAVGVLGDGADARVCQGLDRVLASMARFPPAVVASLRNRIGEMARGMADFAAHRASAQQRVVLKDMGDLDHYCYVVAGTVGHLLTELFCLGSPGLETRRSELDSHAEGFARLLQLTNILKDVTEDWERGFCFLPASALAKEGVPPQALLDPTYRAAAQRVVDGLADVARDQAKHAEAYVRALGAEHIGARRFCLFPMMLALKTLDHAQGNPAVLQPGVPVKVSRTVVAETLAEMERILAGDPST